MEDKQKKQLFGKLRQPLHIEYISKYVLGTSNTEAMEILSPFIDSGIIQESYLAKNYFVLTGPSGPN